MINYDDVTKENINKHNPNWPQISDDLYRIRGTWSGKTSALVSLIKKQDDDDYSIIDQIYLYVKDSYEAKFQYLVKKRWNIGLENLEDRNVFTEYSNKMNDAYKNIEEFNSSRKRNVLIAFGDMIGDMISNKKLSRIVTEQFIRGRKLNISTVFFWQNLIFR